MTSNQHARLVAAVSDAKEAQGFNWKQIATMGGVQQSAISNAINNGVQIKEERWRMICEGLGLDYDEIIAEPETPTPSLHEGESHCEPAPEAKINIGEEREKALDKLKGLVTIKADGESLFLLAMYAEGRLADDIEAGMKVDPMKLWAILDALRIIKQATT